MQAIASPVEESGPVERSARDRTSLWRSSLWALVGLLVFVGIFNFLLPDLGRNLNDTGLIALGIILSLVPALLWLVVFYRLDSREPEPKHLVVTVFFGGLLVAAALYQPVAVNLYTVDSWLYKTWWSQFLGQILVIGALGMGIVYMVVRFVVFTNPEFDERLDGIIYAMAAGLGVATIVNFAYVLQHGGVDLGIGSIRMVTNALGYASFAGVLGYFMGQARFEHTPAYYVPTGVGVAAVLNGVYFFLLDRTVDGPLSTSAWRDLLVAGFVAIVVMAVVGWLVRRSNEETLRVSRLTAGGDAWEPLPAVELVSAPPAAVAETASDVEPAGVKGGGE